jgi:ferredoxin
MRHPFCGLHLISRRVDSLESPIHPVIVLFQDEQGKERNMGRKIVIDEEECIGCGSCSELCPDVFEMDEEAEKARVILPEGGNEECIEEAISTCPVECISWEE